MDILVFIGAFGVTCAWFHRSYTNRCYCADIRVIVFCNQDVHCDYCLRSIPSGGINHILV